jgi:GT2 family glycosyltransferase
LRKCLRELCGTGGPPVSFRLKHGRAARATLELKGPVVSRRPSGIVSTVVGSRVLYDVEKMDRIPDVPIVSVLMPVAQARQYLPRAMESVLTQTFFGIELILIDDAGRSAELARQLPPRDPRARIIASRGKGIADALNTGVETARGQFICRIDCDDLVPPDRIAKQVRWLGEHPDFAAVCGSMSTMTHDGQLVSNVNSAHQQAEITGELRSGITRSSLCTFLMRSDAARQTGEFRRYFVTAEDIDFQLRFGERNRVWFEPLLTYFYRLHDTSITHSQPNTARVFFHETARLFQKQRMETGQDDLERGTPPAPPADASKPYDSALAVQNLLVGASWEQHRHGNKLAAVRLGWQACLRRPASLSAWKNFAALVVKRTGAAPSAGPS